MFKGEFYVEGLLVLVRDDWITLCAGAARDFRANCSRGACSALLLVGSFLQEPFCFPRARKWKPWYLDCVARPVVYLYNTKAGIISFISVSAFLCAEWVATVFGCYSPHSWLCSVWVENTCSKPLRNLTLILVNVSTRVAHAFRLPSCNEISLPFCKLFVLIYLILIIHSLGLSPFLSTNVCSDIFLKSE